MSKKRSSPIPDELAEGVNFVDVDISGDSSDDNEISGDPLQESRPNLEASTPAIRKSTRKRGSQLVKEASKTVYEPSQSDNSCKTKRTANFIVKPEPVYESREDEEQESCTRVAPVVGIKREISSPDEDQSAITTSNETVQSKRSKRIQESDVTSKVSVEEVLEPTLYTNLPVKSEEFIAEDEEDNEIIESTSAKRWQQNSSQIEPYVPCNERSTHILQSVTAESERVRNISISNLDDSDLERGKRMSNIEYCKLQGRKSLRGKTTGGAAVAALEFSHERHSLLHVRKKAKSSSEETKKIILQSIDCNYSDSDSEDESLVSPEHDSGTGGAVVQRFPATFRLTQENVCAEAIQAVLNDSLEGRAILAEYVSQGNLSSASRKLLTTLIINRCSLTFRRGTNAFFKTAADSIETLMPNERAEFYFVAPFDFGNNCKNAKGKLPDKWRNVLYRLRSTGVLPRKIKQ